MNNKILIGSIIAVTILVGVSFIPSSNASITKSCEINKILSEKITVYLGLYSTKFSKTSYRDSGHHLIFYGNPSYLIIDANIDELSIEFVMNYSVSMNYTLKIPYLFAPIVAFGLQVGNNTDYKWKTLKLKHNGYMQHKGNFSVEISIDMEKYESGDNESLYISFVAICEPSFSLKHPCVNTPDNKTSWIYIMRILYNMPLLGKILLYNWLLPIFAPYNSYNGFFRLYFE